jgi:hypothetical protein
MLVARPTTIINEDITISIQLSLIAVVGRLTNYHYRRRPDNFNTAFSRVSSFLAKQKRSTITVVGRLTNNHYH